MAVMKVVSLAVMRADWMVGMMAVTKDVLSDGAMAVKTVDVLAVLPVD